ncbi:MAG: hypothetical protein IH830_06995 [Planctomycetes bacterium]|nr:hypothetical protein [Planctomycetota bacterium]
MPKPVYIVCCESSVEDSRSNLLSFFNVLEKIVIKRTQRGDETKMGLSKLKFCTVAVWTRDESDAPDQEYEAQFAIHAPPGGVEIVTKELKRFRIQEDKQLQRLTLNFVGDPPIKGPGVIRVESRVRAVGTDEWISQDYPIFAEVIGAEGEAEDSAEQEQAPVERT